MRDIFTLISVVILSFFWIATGSSIIYYSKSLFKKIYLKLNPWTYAAAAAMLLEIFLAFVSIILSGIFSIIYKAIGVGILSGIYDGACFSALLSPLTSFISAILGARCRKAPLKYFIYK